MILYLVLQEEIFGPVLLLLEVCALVSSFATHLFHCLLLRCLRNLIIHCFLSQADTFEDAINIVNRNKYFFSSLLVISFVFYCYYVIWGYILVTYLDRYGNGASIFTTSGVAARKFQTEIEAGQVK